MIEQFSRTEILLGEAAMERLYNARVAVFGIGGVGGYTLEALARAGVGRLLLVDDDTVSESNLNRQIVALRSTIGRPKVEVMAQRIRDIDPTVQVETRQCFFSEENADSFDFSAFSYVIDAIDTVSAKVELVCRAKAANTPIWAAAPSSRLLGLLSRGPKSVIAPTPMKIRQGYREALTPI